jgi:hypothetical protein
MPGGDGLADEQVNLPATTDDQASRNATGTQPVTSSGERNFSSIFGRVSQPPPAPHVAPGIF